MSSKYARRPPTHAITPWCIPPPKPPGARVAPLPTFIRAQVIFRASPAPGTPRTVSFYLPAVPIAADGTGAATASNAEYTCLFACTYSTDRKKLAVNAQALVGDTIVAVLQDTPAVLAHPNPLEQSWNITDWVIPAGQSGSIKCWE